MFDRNLLKIPGMPRILCAITLFSLLRASATIGLIYCISYALSALWEGVPLSACAQYLVGFFALFCVQHCIAFAQDAMLDRFSTKTAARLRELLLSKAFDPYSNLMHEAGSGRLIVTAIDGIDEIETYLRILPPKLIGIAALSVPLLIAEFALDWPSGIILFVMLPVIIFFMILLGKQARARAERQYSSYNRLSNRFFDSLRGIDTIASLDIGEFEKQSVYSFSEKLRRATISTLTTATLSSAVLDLAATLGVAGVAVLEAFRLMDGSMALPVALCALMIAPEYFAPIRSFASDFHASLDGKNALQALIDLIGNPSEVDDGRGEGGVAPSAANGEAPQIHFENVSFAYGMPSSDVLEDVSFHLEGPKFVGIVGESGSGKSTLASLAAGLFKPSLGKCTRNYDVHFVPQDPHIFRWTLRDNVKLFKPDASDEDVIHALDVVGLSDFSKELPRGLDTPIGEAMHGMSGGQAHRIALARILLDDDAKILVFDEPTAHLDIQTEYELKQRMQPLFEDKLVLFATHRLHWIEQMDEAIVLTGSGGVEVGTPRQLMGSSAAFRRFVQVQRGEAVDELEA